MQNKQRFTLRLANRDDRVVVVNADEPVLPQLEQAGEVLPFGCRYGACSGCAALLLEGEIDQSRGVALNQSDIDAGYVLLCIGQARSDCVLEVGDSCRAGLTSNPLKGLF